MWVDISAAYAAPSARPPRSPTRYGRRIRQPYHRELPGALDCTRAPKHRELPEHHRGLHDPRDHPIGSAIIVFGDPVADGGKVVPRLRSEANVQA